MKDPRGQAENGLVSALRTGYGTRNQVDSESGHCKLRMSREQMNFVEEVLEAHVPLEQLAEVKRLLYVRR